MVQNERDIRHDLVVEAGRRMMMAARTAPKARGVDIIEIALVSERADLEKLSAVMRKKGEVFLPGKPHGWRSVTGYSLWDGKQSDMTE